MSTPQSTKQSFIDYSQTTVIRSAEIWTYNVSRRIHWSKEETGRYMALLATLTNEGIFDSDEPRTWAPAWPRLLEWLKRFSPNKDWTIELMKAKRETEYKNWLKAQAVVDEYAEVWGRKEDGRLNITNSSWDEFMLGRPVSKPVRYILFDYADIVYKQAFPLGKSTAGRLGEAKQEGDLPSDCSVQIDDSNGVESEPRSRSSAPSSRPSTPKSTRSSRKRSHEPDPITEIPADSDDEPSRALKKQVVGNGLFFLALSDGLLHQVLSTRKGQEGNGHLSIEGLGDAYLKCVLEMAREPGSSDIEKAINYFQHHLIDEIPNDRFSAACRALGEPRQAVAFNALQSKDLKLRYLRSYCT
ncbi:hypothetical protein GGR54DRAFT_601944 [Hypoxylon sp. NC1633]|nr:hypothetical protein GGR54DRAFT_601944 [Hypoxylon sp. NC1633]